MSPVFTKDPWAGMYPAQMKGDPMPLGSYDPLLGKPGPWQPARDPFDADAYEKFMRGLG